MAGGVWIREDKSDADIRLECPGWGDWRDLELSWQPGSKTLLVTNVASLGIGVMSGFGWWDSVAEIDGNIGFTVDD